MFDRHVWECLNHLSTDAYSPERWGRQRPLPWDMLAALVLSAGLRSMAGSTLGVDWLSSTAAFLTSCRHSKPFSRSSQRMQHGLSAVCSTLYYWAIKVLQVQLRSAAICGSTLCQGS